MEMVGDVLSISMPVYGPAVAQLPTLSQTCSELVEAFELLVPVAVEAESEKLAWVETARPDWASVAVHGTETVPVCQPAAGATQETAGAVVSTLVVTVDVLVLPTLSVAVIV